MKTLKKILLLTFIFGILRLLPGCLFRCECDDTALYFDFSKLEINNLDNSGDYIKNTESDTMYRAAVAFNVNVMSDMEYANNCTPIQLLGFSSAMAFSCDCPQKFRANQEIQKISIKTAFDLADEYPSNSDVSKLFYAKDGISFDYNEMYLTFEQLYLKINPDAYYDQDYQNFGIFLSQAPEKDSVQFYISITLSDNRILNDTTNVIYLVE